MSESGSGKFPWAWVLGWIGVYLLIEGVLLGIPLISGSSEAREAQVIDVIGRTGEFVLPMRNGIVPSKPPFFHWVGWLMASIVGGISEFSVRLPSLVFSACVLFFASRVAFALARTLPQLTSPSTASAVARLSVVSLSLTHGFHIMATQAMVDMSYTFFVWGAVCSLIAIPSPEWSSNQRLSPLARAGFFLCLAGAILSRGPLGGALVGFLCCVGGIYFVGVWQTLKVLLRPSVSWCFLLIPLWWYLAAYGQGSGAFVERQLLFENVRRVVGGDHVNTEAWWFYLPSLLRATFPWGVIAILLGISGRSGWMARKSQMRAKAIALPGVVLLAGVVLISSSSGKRHSYLLPFFPIVAIQCSLLIGAVMERADFSTWRNGAQRARRMEFVLGLFSLLILVLGACFMYGGIPLSSYLSLVRSGLQGGAPWALSVLVLTALPLAIGGRRMGTSLRNCAVSLLGILATITCVGNAIKGVSRDFPAMAAQWVSVSEPGEKLAVVKDTFDEYFDPMLFYVRREVAVLQSDAKRLTCDPNLVYLARREWLTARIGDFEGRVTEVRTLKERKASVGKRAPELVAFRCSGAESGEAGGFPPEGSDLRDA